MFTTLISSKRGKADPQLYLKSQKDLIGNDTHYQYEAGLRYYAVGAIAFKDAPAYAVDVMASDESGAAATDGMAVSLNAFGHDGPDPLQIPEVAQGLVIRKVAGEAFDSRETLRTLYLPASISTIGDLAFSNCTKLVNVRFLGTAAKCPSMLVEKAFANTPWLLDGGLLKDASGNVLKKYYASYTVIFDAKGGTGAPPATMTCVRDRVYTLPRANLANASYVFDGWSGSNGRRYDDGVLIFNAADDGKTLALHALWAKPAK